MQDVHDTDGMEVVAPSRNRHSTSGHTSDAAEEEKLAQREEELIQQKVNDVMTSNER